MNNLIIDKKFFLSTDGYSFHYRQDRYSRSTIHVEMFRNGDIVHKQMAKSVSYGVDMSHSQVINELEAKITLGQLDPTGLKQVI